jgi:hypothetical protein
MPECLQQTAARLFKIERGEIAAAVLSFLFGLAQGHPLSN